tara:strand:+ start:905 stop:1993 length:1089 start_codon:yes stop_codon:yes gene_type:complete
MDNNTLFRELAKHYKFTEKDWWQHRQSGSWILAHSAVLKMSCVPTPEGNTILLPSMAEYNWIKKGEEGVFGREVLVGGTFKLLDPKGKTIRSVVAWGEANPLNVNKNVSYPNIMAVKRMIDRGVLGVLAFNQLNIYSAVEAETFSDPKQKVEKKPEPKVDSAPKATEAAARPARTMPQPQPPKPKAPPIQAEKKTLEVNGLGEESMAQSHRKMVLDALSAGSEHVFPSGVTRGSDEKISRNGLSNCTGLDNSAVDRALKELMSEGLVVREGIRRGTKYGLASSSSKPSLTHELFNDLWRDAVGRMTNMGVSYQQIGQYTREVTGHDTAVSAYNAGDLSIDKIEKIFLLGQNWAASKADSVQV